MRGYSLSELGQAGVSVVFPHTVGGVPRKRGQGVSLSRKPTPTLMRLVLTIEWLTVNKEILGGILSTFQPAGTSDNAAMTQLHLPQILFYHL